MSTKERNKTRRYVGPFRTGTERYWKAVTPFLYKRPEMRERFFHRLFSKGEKAQVIVDRCRRIKGLDYHDAEDIALALWTPEL